MTETHVSSDPQTFTVMNNEQPMIFTGYHLASADTQQGHSVRWTELGLYRTMSGKYILEKIGRSDVFHEEGCTQRSKGLRFVDLDAARAELFSDEDEDREFVPCDRCRPGPNATPIFAERDILSASVYPVGSEVIDALMKPNSDHKFLTRLGRELLNQAAIRDELIAQLLRAPVQID